MKINTYPSQSSRRVTFARLDVRPDEDDWSTDVVVLSFTPENSRGGGNATVTLSESEAREVHAALVEHFRDLEDAQW